MFHWEFDAVFLSTSERHAEYIRSNQKEIFPKIVATGNSNYGSHK
jgi:hypothetical protein